MLDLDKIAGLYQLLKRTRNGSLIFDVVKDLMESPDDIRRQIAVAGVAHGDKLSEPQKQMLWEAFNRQDPLWVKTCVNAILTPNQDHRIPWIAACALLELDPMAVLKEIVKRSPTLIGTWDVEGADNCGIMVASPEQGAFDHCFYIGWGVRSIPGRISRIDYIENVLPVTEASETWLSRIKGECLVRNSFWAAMPSGWGHIDKEWKSFYADRPFYLDPCGYGYTREVRKKLGLA